MENQQETIESLERRLEILDLNYWEHFNYAKNLSLVLHPKHPKRKEYDKTLSDMLKIINPLKQKLNELYTQKKDQ